jgi:digeranylgeranylglycerophospholipid reductase
MQLKYDAVVIGAGPAGSMAAYEIATAGYSVIIFEKHKTPGLPLSCAEAVSRGSFEKIITPEKDWVCTEIDRAKVIGPFGDDVTAVYPGGGLILDRKKLDYSLVSRAVKAGCLLICKTIGLELEKDGDSFRSIEILRANGERQRIKASIFIAADGVESKIARAAGMDNLVNIDEVESLLQYRLDNIDVDPKMIEFYVGNDIAPGGYLYIFPKSESSANVGLGIIIDGYRSDKLEFLLNNFIEQKFGRAHIAEKICGLTPKYQGKKMFRKDNLLVVGDAARALDSLSGAGIVNAMTSGRYAGLAAVEYLESNIKNEEEFDDLYPGRFLKERGEELLLYVKLKNAYRNFTDDDFTEVIKALNKYLSGHDVRQINASRLLMGILMSRPKLLRLARYLL